VTEGSREDPPAEGDPDDPLAEDPAARRRRRRFLRDTLLVVAALLVLGIVFSILQTTIRFLDDDDFTADGVRTIDLRVDDGDVSVEARPTPDSARSAAVEARVRYFLRKPEVLFENDGADARLRTRCEWPSRCDIDVRSSVPAATDVTTRTGSGDLLVEGPAGVVDARTSNGSVTVRDATRDVRAAVGDGDLRIVGVSGAVRGEVVAGEFEVEDVGGALRLRTGEGGLTATGVRSSDVEIESGAGNVEVEFDERPARVEIEVGAGNLTVGVPAGRYRIDAEVEIGDLEVSGIDEDPDATRRITIRSGEGDVTVRGA